MSKTSLDGKVALVTGASSGIGRATAQVLAEKGAQVVVADISEETGNETVELLGGSDIAHYVRVDVADEDSARNVVEQTIARFGRLDIAANIAGIAPGLDFTADLSKENWDRLIGVNLTGIFLALKAQIPAMLERGGGSIVNMGSILSVVGQAGQANYVAAKHGVIGLTRTAALEYASRGIRVNAVLPAVIRTPLLDSYEQSQPALVAEMTKGHPIGRLGKPEEVGEAVAWLASDAASFVTGTALHVDGGYTAQ